MRRRLPALSIAVALAAVAGRPGAAGSKDPGDRMRGVCWEGAGPITPRHLEPLRDLGADWISQTPFGWSRSVHEPEVHLATGGRVLWGESDSGLVRTARWARARGIRTLLKPHLWVHHGWVGDLDMASEADWQRWFASYERFILHYARLAEREGMEVLAVGTELVRSSQRTADWRRIIARVRGVYHGPLTYCANWHDEAERIEFWDALDFVGVQAYYPLADSTGAPDLDAIRCAWGPVAERLAALARRTGKRVVFTEVGYKSAAGSLHQPWSWSSTGAQDLDLQHDAYRALFETFWSEPWFGGTFVWKWHPGLLEGWGRAGRDFTPQGKPALAVLCAWYRGDAAAPGTGSGAGAGMEYHR